MSSSSAATSKVSFTIRRPTPVSRGESDSDSSTFKVPTLPRHLSNGANTPNSPLAHSAPHTPKSRTYSERDSSDEESEAEDELVTAFDRFGAQRLHERPEPEGPLVIPALKNLDWRELARKRKQVYVPPSAAVATGADGSVGGLGTRDTINSGPQASGIQVKKRVKVEDTADAPMPESLSLREEEPKQEETDDQKALRAILASATSGDDAGIDGPQIDMIPPTTEDDAYRQDVVELPDSASLEDYERVPVAQFGAALLRGMGWKEGAPMGKRGKGMVEPWLPQSRPALLGIGAKEREIFDDGIKGKRGGKARPEKRYVPVVKKERSSESGEGDRQRNKDSTNSRCQSRSPSSDWRRERKQDGRRDDRDRFKDNDRDRHHEREREKDRDRYKERERDRDRRRDDYDFSPRDRDRDRDGRKNRSRSRDRYDSTRKRDKGPH